MKLKLTSIAVIALMMFSCGGESPSDATQENTASEETVAAVVESIDPMQDKGVGPITNVELGEIDNDLAATGEELFELKCTACHKMGKRFVGPNLEGVTERRTPEWTMNMILNPDVMVKENQLAKELLMEYSAPMANQSLTEDEARSIYEYFRVNDSSKG